MSKIYKFKIHRISKKFYLIRQRHTVLFFFHIYDLGSSLLRKKNYAKSRNVACELIAKAAKEKGFQYEIVN